MSEEHVKITTPEETDDLMEQLQPFLAEAVVEATDALDIHVVSVMIAMIANLTDDLVRIDRAQAHALIRAQADLIDPRPDDEMITEAQKMHTQATISLCRTSRAWVEEHLPDAPR